MIQRVYLLLSTNDCSWNQYPGNKMAFVLHYCVHKLTSNDCSAQCREFLCVSLLAQPVWLVEQNSIQINIYVRVINKTRAVGMMHFRVPKEERKLPILRQLVDLFVICPIQISLAKLQ
jgi:hypothetical protein